MKRVRPELLAPAGDIERLKYAVAYGADAVYCALTSYGMRTACPNFTREEMVEGIAFAHQHGAKVYVTTNTMPRSMELEAIPETLKFLAQAGADAFIIADPGVMKIAEKNAPEVAVHVSTQANILNYASANFWYDMGASRIVLARELSMSEIELIRQNTPEELELEVFVHGAMCMSYSGRCYISDYLTGRNANSGACAQPCRWKYFLTEEKRPGEYFPVTEDGNGAYVFNSKDLCLVGRLRELEKCGVCSFKIEGRAKTAYYAACVTSAYRRAIDDLYTGNGEEYTRGLSEGIYTDELNKCSHREYYEGFFAGDHPSQIFNSSSYVREYEVAAELVSCDESGNAMFRMKNRIAAGEEIEIMSPGRVPDRFVPEKLWDEEGAEIPEAMHPHMLFGMKLNAFVPEYTFLRKKTAEWAGNA